VLACTGAAPVTVEAPGAAGSAETPPRRPDAVVVEPPAAMPSVVARAEARGVVALREPPAGDAVRDVVQQLAAAWQAGSVEALMALLTADAGPIEGRGRGRGPLVESWRQRLHAHDYTRLSGVDVFRPERIERWTWDELGAAGAPTRPADMHHDEVVVRVPVEVTHLSNEKVFEDIVVLVLRLEDSRYKIAAYGEVER